jgi:hypothetical protein
MTPMGWTGSRTAPTGPPQPQRHPHRGPGQDHLPVPALPLRAGQDRHVPPAPPRHPAQPPGWGAGPEAAGAEPAAGLPTAPSATTGAGSARSSRCPATASSSTSSSSPAPRTTPQALPAHRDRGPHPAARAAQLRPGATSRPPSSPRRCAGAAPVPGRGHPGRQRVEFGASFPWHVLDKGIGHIDIKPRTPRRNGKVERSHRLDAEGFHRLLDGVVIDDAQVLNDELGEWEDFYNYHRPHGSLDGQTPMNDASSAPRPGCTPSPSLPQI